MSKTLRRTLYIAGIMVILFFGGRIFIFWKLKSTIVTKIEELRTKGFLINYSSIESNSFTGTVAINDLEIDKTNTDSVCSTSGTIEKLEVQGISIIPFLLKKKLSLSSITLIRPWVQYSAHPKKKSTKVENPKNSNDSPLKGVEIGLIRIDSGRFQMVDSATCSVSLKSRFNLELQSFTVTSLNTDSLRWKMESFIVNGISLDLPKKFYHFSIQQVAYSRNQKSIQLDCLRLIPTVDRKEFARRSNDQVDQFTLIMPLLKIQDFAMSETLQPSVIAREVNLNFNMNVFRDKRYERKWRKPKVLPMTFMHKLSFPVRIDSLILSPSDIVYEEHPEKNDGVGKISFNELAARIYNISNDSIGESLMKVHTKFMRVGEMNVDFTFPHEKNKLYGVKGSLVNFSMPEINTMLEPAALIKIESGKMQAMKFNFKYDSKESNGELELRYTDLQVVALKKDDKSKNEFVSLIIKALLKKKIDKNDPVDKRTGAIHWERDTQKAVLNYWWKSVLSGVKSVFGFEAKKEKKK